jgi:hypothetical protein
MTQGDKLTPSEKRKRSNKVGELRTVQFARPDIELQHRMIPCTLNPRDFTEWLLLAINIAMAYREDIA